MSLSSLSRPFPWAKYSKKVASRIDNPYCIGSFTPQDANERDVHLAVGSQGKLTDGNIVFFYWLVDKQDGVIIDARFQAFGDTALIAASEAACELIIGKNYDQARRIGADLIDTHLRDKSDISAFPEETHALLNLVVDAIEVACKSCEGIPLSQNYSAPPITGHQIEAIDGGYPNWKELPLKDKIAVIDHVLSQEVRPFIELDAGGVEVINLINDREVIISYQGSCTSCYSATGATLSYIQQVLRAKVHPDLEVIPNL